MKVPDPHSEWRGARLLLVCGLCLVVGCAERRDERGSKAPPATTSFFVPAAGPRGLATGVATPSPESMPSETTPPPPEPTAHYASIEAARDTIESILRHAVSAADTAIHFRREAVTFKYHYAPASARGWAFHVVVNDTSSCPSTALQQALVAAGWVEDYGYGADGTDGEDMGYVCRQFLCVVEAQWDGGDDSDTTYVPLPGCKVTATCVPRRADDVLPR